MSESLSWEQLLNQNRRRVKKENEEEKEEKDHKTYLDHRNEFEKDYDRVVASSSVRRLQDKAQVYPLQHNDFTRTRLTHSMEVSAIARSFGTWLEQWLFKNEKIDEDALGKIPSLLAVAGMVHDIGNPPFGHYGEDVIKRWFKEWFETSDAAQCLLSEEKNDFLHFDGNAQGIRILTRLQFLNDQYGLNLTYAALSVLMKYPWSSSNELAVKGKFGFFKQDSEIAKEIIQNTVGRENIRHPLTYFLEAADDIAYLGADVEDSVKKGVIPWDKEFNNIIKTLKKYYPDSIKKIEAKHNNAIKNDFPDYCLTSVQNFRVWAQGQMIKEVIEVFEVNYDDIIKGKYREKDLLEKTKHATEIKKILFGLAKKYCYPSKEVLSLELVGDSVITDLLSTFVSAVLRNDIDYNKDTKSREGKLYRMISDNFRFVHLLNDEGKKTKSMQDLSVYDKLLLVTDFISGMTDSYALDLHQKLKGVKMP
ncbi:dGTP triphosphohydrolase [Brevibacillus formosus]|uniref:dGTP triphosphohydrolase n=1 Tax=Brevibacillus formosus TaxID=54913 RepID=UPI003F1B5D86